MSQNNLNTMYGGGFARIMDTNKKVYRLVNVINARVSFESQTDTLRAVFPNAPSQIIATATTQMNCMISATLAEFNADQFSLASNLLADEPGDDASMPVINERHVCLSNQFSPSYLPQSGKPINVYALRNGRELKLDKVSKSSASISNRVIKAGRLVNAEFTEDVLFTLPIEATDFAFLTDKLGYTNGIFLEKIAGEEIELQIEIGGGKYPVTFKALATNVDAVNNKLKVTPKFNLSGVNNDISYEVWYLDQSTMPSIPTSIGTLTNSATGNFTVDASTSISLPHGTELLFIQSGQTPTVSSFGALAPQKQTFSDGGQGGQSIVLATGVNQVNITGADVSVAPVPAGSVRITTEDGVILYAKQFIYEAPTNGDGTGTVTLSNVYIGQGVSMDYERRLASGTYWMMGGSSTKQMGYVDFYLTLQTQQGTWIFYRFPACWPSGKYQLDMQGSFMNLPIEFTCVALPGYNLPYIVYGEIQQ